MPESMTTDTEFDANKNLIVNYLPGSLTQDDVKQMFAHIGPVSNCKLVRNKETGQSLGYAFIKYDDDDLAARAIVQINGIQLQGKTVKVSYARPSTPEIQNTNIYVAGLPEWVTEDQLLSIFLTFGTVLSHKVLRNPDGTTRGAGFVRYSLNQEASKAIKEMNGKSLPDSTGPLTVKLAIPPSSKQDPQALGSIVTNTLAGFGATTHSSNVRFNPLGKNPTAHHTASAVAAALTQHATGACVYIFGLKETHTELTLYELFSPFGGILNVKLIRDLQKEDKPCKGYGFVNYTKGEDAMTAVTAMNGVTFEDKVLQVSIKQKKDRGV